MKNIQVALNRHIYDLERDIDIVRDTEFMSDTILTLSTGCAPHLKSMSVAIQNNLAGVTVSSALAVRDTPNVNTMNTALSNNFMSFGFISNSSNYTISILVYIGLTFWFILNNVRPENK